MTRLLRIAALLSLACIPALPQSGGLPGAWNNQFFSNNGQPLNAGRIYTCIAGSSCPGAPRATYTDSSLFTQNQNPIILDTAGRPSNGGSVVGIWLNPSLAYKFVVQNSSGSTIFTVDNVTSATAGGAATNYWTLAGSTISNNNAGGSGTVAMGGNASVGSNLTIAQTLGLKSSSTQHAFLRAANTMVADVTWVLPAADGAGCVESDGMGNLSITACGGGGGGGSPGGVTGNVQYNNGTTFAGSNNLFWDNAAQLLTVASTGPGAAAISASTGFIQSAAGFVTAATPINAIQAPNGGVTSKWQVVTDSQFWIEEAAPALSGAGQSKIYMDSGTHTLQVSENGGGFVSLVGGGGGSPGGPSGAVQFNVGGISLGGDAALTWDNTLKLITVTTPSSAVAGVSVVNGFVQSGSGFLSNAAAINTVNIPNGGVTSKWHVATDSMFWAEEAAPALSAVGQSRVYMDSTSHLLRVSQNGGAYTNLVGGGGGSPAGSNLSFQYSNGGAFAGTYNGVTGMWWDDTNKLITLTTTGATAAIAVNNGFIQAAGGFVTSGSATNVIQAANGGVTSKWHIATDSMFWVEEVAPALSAAGQSRMYMDSSTHSIKVSQNGSAYATLGTSGVTTLNSLSGALSIACAAASSCSIGAAGATVTITAPQPLATTSTPTFGAITSTGAITSSVAGLAFQAGGGNFQVSSTGAISTAGAVTSTTGFNVTTTTAVNSIQTTGGIEACNSGSCSGGSAMRINGTQVATSSGYWIGLLNTPLTGSSNLFIGGGNLYTRYTGGVAALVSCGGVNDGWFAVTSDNQAVFCILGSRYRVALTSF